MRTKFLLPVLAFFIASASCSIFTPVVKNVTDPTTPVGAIVADCAKPEVADQVGNLLASINQIIVDPSKLEATKEAEIASLKAAGQEVLACALRAGIADITAMIRDAAAHNAALDPRAVSGRSTMERVVRGQGFAYADGWSPSASSGAGGAGGSHGN
jgi:hypothetical protein